MKNIVKLILLIIPSLLFSQEKDIGLLIGYNTIDASCQYTSENELIYGFGASIVESNIAEKRANNNDKGKIHKFNNSIVPAIWGNIGAKFDELSIIGKIGLANVNQSINNIKEPKNIYLAFGIIFDYKISEKLGIRLNYDSVNSLMGGISYKIN